MKSSSVSRDLRGSFRPIANQVANRTTQQKVSSCRSLQCSGRIQTSEKAKYVNDGLLAKINFTTLQEAGGLSCFQNPLSALRFNGRNARAYSGRWTFDALQRPAPPITPTCSRSSSSDWPLRHLYGAGRSCSTAQ